MKNETREFNYKKVVIHDGTYHLDDLLCALFARRISVLRKEGYSQIIRTSNESEIKEFANDCNTIICDVGGGEFDHHQKDGKINPETGTKFSAFGLMWSEFAPYFFKLNKISDPESISFGMRLFETSFLNEVDKTDNEGQKKWPSALSFMVSSAQKAGVDFWEAFQMLYGIFNATLEGVVENVKMKEKAMKMAKETKGDIVYLKEEDKFIPAFLFEGTQVRFVISKSNRGEGLWNINCVPGNIIPTSIEVGKDGCTFVHTARFIATFDSCDAAYYSLKTLSKEEAK